MIIIDDMILHTLIIHYNVGIMSRDLPSQLPSHFLTKMSSHKTLPWLTCTQKFMANGWIRRQSLKRHFTIFLPLFALTKPSSMLTGHGIGIAPLLLNMKRVANVTNHKLGKCQLCCPSSVYIRRKCLCLLVNA